MTTTREQLGALNRALRDLHKQLIHIETQYFGQVGSPLEQLQLITNHPQFAWLQKLSGLMAQLDERLEDAAEITSAEARAFRQALEMLIGPCEEGNQDFRAKYNAMLHDGPELVMSHGAVRKVMATIG